MNRVRLVAAAVFVLGALVWSPASAGRPTDRTASVDVHDRAPATTGSASVAQTGADGVEFVSQTLWQVGARAAELRFRITAASSPEELEVAVAIYPRLTSRSDFTQTLEGRLQRSALSLQRFPVPTLVADPTGVIALPLEAAISRQGVYPLRLELRDSASGDVIDAFTSHLVHIPAPIEGEKLTVGLALPFGAPIATRPDGSLDISDEDVTRLGDLAGAFGRTAIPLTVLPRGETLDALANGTNPAGRSVLTSLSAAAPGRLFLPHHYVETSLPSLLEADLEQEAERQGIRAAAAIGAQVSGADISTGIWVTDDAVDEAALDHLEERGVTRLVVPEAALTPLNLDITLTQTFELRTDRSEFTTAASDPGLRAHFLSSQDPALAAHHLLADLAVLYFDRPGLSRGIAVVPPAGWEADPRFVGVLMRGLAGSPVLSSDTLAAMFDRVPPLARRGEVAVRSLQAQPGPELFAMNGAAVRTVRSRLDSLVEVLSPFNPIIEEVDRTLLASESRQLRRNERRGLLEGANRQIDDVLSQVALPGNRSITLTAREGEIPITISSEIPYPIRASLQLRSGPLSFPRGDTIPVQLTRSNLTQRVTVRADTSGSFPLRVELVSPDGRLVLGETRVTVRSTAVSGVGVALSAGAALFLALWWARHLRGQRSKRLVPT